MEYCLDWLYYVFDFIFHWCVVSFHCCFCNFLWSFFCRCFRNRYLYQLLLYYVNSLITDSTCIYVLRWFSDDSHADFADLRISVNAVANILLLWPWSYGSWIYNYLCNQCLSRLMFLCHDIIFLKVTLNTIKQTNKQKSEERIEDR